MAEPPMEAGAGSRSRTPLRAAMREKPRTTEGRAVYARRKAITEPVHRLIKQARNFRQFLLRGPDKVAGEFTLVALTHKILKLWRASLAPAGSAKEASRTRFLTAAAPPPGQASLLGTR